ncbi:MAG: hypothetical protein ACFFEF_04850 [Candidatus Thorarchaeota archaeon]
MANNKESRLTDTIFEFLEATDEEPVQLMLAALDSGISLVSVEFQPDLDGDESLLSGFVSALRFASHGIFLLPFDEIRFGKYTMLVRADPPFLFSYIFRGNTKHFSQRLEMFINTLREKAPLLTSLKKTMLTGEVNLIARSSIENLAAEIFSYSGGPLWRCK